MSNEKKTVDWKDFSVLANREDDVRELCNRLLSAWGYNLDDRRPGIAYVDAQGHPVTDMDLAVFLSSMVQHRVVANLPEYKARRAATKRDGEWVTSKENRHGRLMGLISNQALGSFGVRIEDLNVIQVTAGGDTKVGAPRAMNLVDITGEWYGGWSEGMEILPTGLPKAVFASLTEATKTLKFQYFIHPNRWPSLYGVYYAVAKGAILRLEDERKVLRKVIAEMQEKLGIPKTEWPKSETVGESKKVTMLAYEVKLEGFTITGDYPYNKLLDVASKGAYDTLVALNRRLGEFLEQLRFLTRATEYAFRHHAVKPNISDDTLKEWLSGATDKQPRLPAWIKSRTEGSAWETGYKETERAKNRWARLPIQDGKALLFRVWEKTETVAA